MKTFTNLLAELIFRLTKKTKRHSIELVDLTKVVLRIQITQAGVANLSHRCSWVPKSDDSLNPVPASFPKGVLKMAEKKTTAKKETKKAAKPAKSAKAKTAKK